MAPGKVVGLTMGRLNNEKQCICQNLADIILGPRDNLKTARRSGWYEECRLAGGQAKQFSVDVKLRMLFL